MLILKGCNVPTIQNIKVLVVILHSIYDILLQQIDFHLLVAANQHISDNLLITVHIKWHPSRRWTIHIPAHYACCVIELAMLQCK